MTRCGIERGGVAMINAGALLDGLVPYRSYDMVRHTHKVYGLGDWVRHRSICTWWRMSLVMAEGSSAPLSWATSGFENTRDTSSSNRRHAAALTALEALVVQSSTLSTPVHGPGILSMWETPVTRECFPLKTLSPTAMYTVQMLVPKSATGPHRCVVLEECVVPHGMSLSVCMCPYVRIHLCLPHQAIWPAVLAYRYAKASPVCSRRVWSCAV
jgi:hypothetical protein